MLARLGALVGGRWGFAFGGTFCLSAPDAEADGCAAGGTSPPAWRSGSAVAAAEFSDGGGTGLGSRAGFEPARSAVLPFFMAAEEMFGVAGLWAISAEPLPPKIEKVPMTTRRMEKTTTPAAAAMAREYA